MKRKSYKVGNVFKIREGSGIDSNKLVTSIHWFYWKLSTDGTYFEPDRRHSIAVRYEDGRIGFFPKSRLIAMSKEDVFDYLL